MNFLDRVILALSPRRAMEREKSRTIAMHYRAARLGLRNDGIRPSGSDADLAGRNRRTIAFYARDMIRNTPFATRVQQVISGNVVGDGIIPKIQPSKDLPDEVQKRIRARGLELVEDHLDTTAIDRHGLQNLYGLQTVAANTIVDAGEVLIRRHRPASSGLAIPLQIEVLEPDYIDDTRFGRSPEGNEIREGIEYDRGSGDRVAYWLYTQHPGGEWRPGSSPYVSERVPAEDLIHVFRVDRPGQTRGVSWYTPIAEKLLNLDDSEDAHLMRQKIAACFAAFHRMGPDAKPRSELGGTLQPGVIMEIGENEDMEFSDPPDVGGFDEFQRGVLRSAAMGVGITYEALTGDLSGVNFSSARIGRLEMDRNISKWQWLTMVPMFLQPFGRWFVEAWAEAEGNETFQRLLWEDPRTVRLSWVPPHRILVDPAREFSALREAVRSGFQSRQGVVRQLGIDPERLVQEQLQDKDEADRLGLPFDSDPRADISRKNPTFTDKDRTDE
ncbi:phage portal protein [Paracoccus sp. MBLB3053]|uniref:Phage portal protein n=1 Tax=Paracoccus aurantius TaxID=3073814 RepID=A0ABU2HT26_9RHOB|nr:phage portal protein [Paracoccus sp. MBLB3053]MDS9468205.1 phage portal protein [Paracoccus sp. MBLB3053]